MKKSTSILTRKFRRPDAYNAISMPVYNSVAYEFPDADSMAETFCGKNDSPDYSRITNPTVYFLEDQIKELKNAAAVTALNSGMAAISGTLMAVAAAGKCVVSSRHLFGNTYLLLTSTLSRFGVETLLLDLTDATEVSHRFPANACCIFLESVTNPQLEVADVRALAAIAHAHGVPLIADTTAIPPTEFDGRALGIDFEIVSSTKYVSGGATCLGGLIIDYGNFPDISRRIKSDILFNLGAYMTPQVAYMHLLGLENLEVRYARQSASALYLARELAKVPGIVEVNYPGLPGHPYHHITREQYGSFGAMLTLRLADEAACRSFIDRLAVVRRATNLFDNKTLAIHPWSTIFGPLPEAERTAMDVRPDIIRLSVGLEDPDDILADLAQAASGNEKLRMKN